MAGAKPKPKKCKAKGCGVLFTPSRSFQCWCSPECGLSIARAKREQADQRARSDERKKDRERKRELQPMRYFHKATKFWVHKYIRLRDKDEPCISCGAIHAAQWDAGHFIGVGADSALRYDLANINKQCCVCNQHKSGNLILYRQNLIAKIGEPEVLRLEGPQPVHKWTRSELESIKAAAKQLIKELEKETDK